MIPEDVISQLVTAARAARARAYAPYSRYTVGAAVLTGSGKVVTGCNIENASYGLTVCAERVAVWAAVAAGERRIKALAVATSNAGSPCGACRQVLAEFAPASRSDDDLIVIVAGPRTHQVYRLSELLPHAFEPRHLENPTV